MKKITCSFILFILIISLCCGVFAYSTTEFSIDIPSTYTEVGKNSFTSPDGNNVNIQITQNSSKKAPAYSEEELNILVDSIFTEMDNYRNEIVTSLKDTYGDQLTEEEIIEYVNSFKCNSIDIKEITTFSKNNYKCFHIIANYSMGDYDMFANQYSVTSGSNIYTLTISSTDKSFFETDEVKNMIDSFTINDFQEAVATDKANNNIVIIVICAVAGMIIGGVISYKTSTKNSVNKSE